MSLYIDVCFHKCMLNELYLAKLIFITQILVVMICIEIKQKIK